MNEATVPALYWTNVTLNPNFVTQQKLQYKIIFKYEIWIYLIIITSITYIKITVLWHLSKLG